MAMKKQILVLAILTLTVSQCALFQAGPGEGAVSYQQTVAPIIKQHCSPCHFPARGRAEMLNSYSAVRAQIGDILHRVQLDEDHPDYMPFKQKRPALSTTQIALIYQWRAEGFAP